MAIAAGIGMQRSKVKSRKAGPLWDQWKLKLSTRPIGFESMERVSQSGTFRPLLKSFRIKL